MLATDSTCRQVQNVLYGPLPVQSCFRCVQATGCGYCGGALQTCMAGNTSMDAAGLCPAGDWETDVCANPIGYMSVAAMVFYLFAFGRCGWG